jgi:hypothetical protein
MDRHHFSAPKFEDVVGPAKAGGDGALPPRWAATNWRLAVGDFPAYLDVIVAVTSMRRTDVHHG